MNYLSPTITTAIKCLVISALQKFLNREHTLLFQAISMSFESLNWLKFYDIFRVFFGIGIGMGITGNKNKSSNFQQAHLNITLSLLTTFTLLYTLFF